MSKKKWLLLFLCILLLAGYWKFFYKAYSETAVAKSADCILALDVKRVTNTVMWNILTAPGQWKKISYSRSSRISWKDMVKVPDYVFVFHSKDQPANAWYSSFQIKDEIGFINGLLFYHFEKGDSLPGLQVYFSVERSIVIVKSGNKILVGNNAVENKSYIIQVAKEMFLQKRFIAREKLFKNVEASCHLSLVIEKNNFLQDDAIVKMNFDRNAITVHALFSPKKQFAFSENNFTCPVSPLCATGFTQPPAAVYNLLTADAKTKISKTINFNIDSLLLQSNHYYNLDIAGITPRIDSAISYVYDDNFSKVEKVVVNKVMEPSFSLNIQGDSIAAIFNYWNNNGQFEKTASGTLFLPIPFVRSYCNKKNEHELSIASGGFQNSSNIHSINCIFFFQMLLTAIPAEILKYLPAELINSIENMASVEITLKKSGENIKLEGKFNKKENELPVLDLDR